MFFWASTLWRNVRLPHPNTERNATTTNDCFISTSCNAAMNLKKQAIHLVANSPRVMKWSILNKFIEIILFNIHSSSHLRFPG